MRSYPLRKLFALWLAVSVTWIASQKTFAATTGFNQTAAGPWDYNTAGNWANSTINGIWDPSLTLAGAQTVQFAADTTLTTGLTFNYGGNFALTLQASAAGTKNLTLGGDIGLNTSGGTSANVTIGNSANHLNVDLGGANRTFTIASSRTLTFVDVLSGSGFGITTTCLGTGGTLTLQGVNTYTGPTVINAGTLTLSGSASISSSSALTLGSGTLNRTITSGTQTFNNTTLNGFGTVTTAAGGTVALGTITRNVGSILNISSSSGSTTAGNSVDSTGILGTWATMLTGTSLRYAAGGSGSAIATYTSGTAAATAASVTDTTGAVNYDVAAVGTLGASASFNTLRYTGAAGTIAGNFTANGLMNAGSGAVIYSGNLMIGANKELVIVGNTQGTTISGVIADNGGGASSLTCGGPSPGTLVLSSANTYSGGTTIDAGVVEIATDTSLGSGTVTLAGGTLRSGTSSTDRTIANAITAKAGFSSTLEGGQKNLTLSGNISGSGILSRGVATGNSVFLNGDNSGFTGTFIVKNSPAGDNSAVLRFKAATAGSANASWVFNNLNSGKVTLDFSSGTISFGSLTGGGIFGMDGNSFSGDTISVGALGLNDIFSGVLQNGTTGTGLALTKVGTGTMTLTGANSYTMATTVRDGSLVAGAAVAVSANGPFGSASSAIALGDATTISSATAMNPKLLIGGAFTMARTVTVGANNNSLGNASTTFTLGGNTANSSTFSGAITLNQSLVVTQVMSGTLTISGNITSGSSGTQTVTVNNPGTVNIGTGVIGGGTGTIALTANGPGTLALTGAHTYTGNTTVTGGTLLVNGSTASGSSVSVSGSGSVLGGSGTISGNTTISSSGALAPRPSGGSATTTTFGGNLTLSSASASFTLSSSAGGSNDKVIYGSSGTLTLDNTDTISITGATLDTASDYTLFTSSGGTVSMVTTPTLKVNGVTSDQTSAGNYQLVVSGSSLKLHYIQTALPPTINSASASPTSLGHYQTTTITVNVTPQSGKSISSVTATLDQLGGAGDPTTLTGPGGDGTGNWTGTFTVPPTLAAGSYTISGVVNQSDATAAAWSVTGITVTNASPTWNGSGADNKWSTGGNWDVLHGPGLGDSVAFSGSSQAINNFDVSISVASLTFNSGAGSFTITNSANTLTLTGGVTNNSANAQTVDVPVALSGSQTVSAASGDITLSRAISGGAGLTKAGNNTLTLSGLNTYSGATTVGSGLLTIGGAGLLGGGNYSGNITDNGALNVASSADQTWSGIISGTGSLTNSGTGTLTLNGANTFSGGTTITAGTIVFGNGSAFGTGTITANGGTLRGGVTTANNLVVNGATTLDVATGNWDINGNISGTGVITRGTTATLTLYLNGDNSGYAGTFTVPNNGNAVVRFGHSAVTGVNAGSAAASWVFNDTTVGRTTLSWTGTGAISFGSMTGSGQIQTDIAGAKTISVGALGLNDTFSGTIANGTGTIGLTKVGSGTMTLSGANTYSGGTTLSAGQLNINSAGSGGTSSAIGTGTLTISGGTIDNTSSGDITLSPTITQNWNGDFAYAGSLHNLNLGAGTVTLGANRQITVGGNTLTVGGVIGDGGNAYSLTKLGAGTLTLSGANTYTGNTVISNGVLALSGSGSIANSTNIILSGATFDVSGLSSTFTLGSGKVLMATNNAMGTVAGNLNLGSGSLVLNYTNGTPSLLVTNGTFTFNNNAVTVTVSGTQLASGSYKLISKATAGNAGLVAGTLPSSVTVNGAGAATVAGLQIIGGELYLVVNHPPVASTMNVTRTAGLSVKIAWSDLATNWTDADGDTMSLNTFNLTTTNGVTLQTNGTWILYTNNVNVADQFSYTIIDARGATATGLVNIIINPFVTGQNTTVAVSGSSAAVSFYGIPGYSYITQRATNIVTPNWVDISTNTAPGNGAINVTDGFSDLGNVPDSAYYRLKWQP